MSTFRQLIKLDRDGDKFVCQIETGNGEQVTETLTRAGYLVLILEDSIGRLTLHEVTQKSLIEGIQDAILAARTEAFEEGHREGFDAALNDPGVSVDHPF